MLLSCGILVRPAIGRLLLGHATGWRWWDIPKGLSDAGEPPREAAVRECREETGLDFGETALVDLGRHAYYRGKDLHLFMTPVFDAPEAATLKCTSFYVDEKTGRSLPEFDRFRYADRSEIEALCGKSLVRLLGSLEW
ncbi:NUDIX hydrolase [soil metagenome]